MPIIKTVKNKVKVLRKDVFFTDDDKAIHYEITESICSQCKRKWVSVYLEGKVIFGGSSSCYKGGKWIDSCGQGKCLGIEDFII